MVSWSGAGWVIPGKAAAQRAGSACRSSSRSWLWPSPLCSRDVLHAGPSGYGLLWSAFGAGALLGLGTVPIVSCLRPGLALAGNALLWGTTLLPLFLMTNIIPAMLVLALGGLV